MGTLSQAVAGAVASLSQAAIPDDVARAAVRHLTDACGVALAAAARGGGHPMIDMTRSWAGAREAAVLGFDLSAPAPAAALANGTLTHALDFDDTHVGSGVHPSAVIMPAAFAVGQEIGASGAEVLVAAVAGYEVATRIGAAAPGRFAVRGFDPTGIAGPLGAAMTAGKLWGLTVDELTAALGIAASTASGLLAFRVDGADSKRFHAGWAAHAGIIAADLARRGATGPTTIVEGPHGLFDSFLAGEDADRDLPARDIGERWETTRIAIKPYPASQYVHASMDAAARTPVTWADIEEVECAVAPAVVDLIAEPRATKLHPPTLYAAQTSLPFAVATAIVGGRSGLDLFGDDARADRRVLTLAEKIHHTVDPTLPFPASNGGRVTIHTRLGRTLVYDEPIERGHPDRPLEDDALAEKFLGNAASRLDEDGARRAKRALDDLVDAPRIDAVIARMQVPG